MKIQNITLTKIKKVAEYTSYLLGLSFVCGFLIWNTYLYALGFKEDNIIQTRFIFTGITFIIFTFLLYLILNKLKIKIWDKLPFIKNKKREKRRHTLLLILFLIIYYFLYIYFIFTLLPLMLGGGRPSSLSIITDSEEIIYLQNFGILTASDIQTQNLCIAYENNDYAVILLTDRILQIKKDKIKGYGSLPGISVVNSRKCLTMTKVWIFKTFYFNFLNDEKITDLEFPNKK